MQLPNSDLENHPAGLGDLNAIVSGNWESLEAMFNPGQGSTASQALFVVTCNNPIFMVANIGDSIVWVGGGTAVITAVASDFNTVCTVAVSQTIASGAFYLYHVNPDAYTALARGLLKQPNIQLAHGQPIIWSTTRNRFVGASGFFSMGVGCFFTATADATAANTSAQTSIAPTGVGTKTIAANYLAAGKTIRVSASGVVSTIGAPGTLRMIVKVGAVVVLDTTALTPSANLTNVGWRLTGEITCRTTGAGGTVIGQGRLQFNDGTVFDLPNTAAAALDTTGARNVDVLVTWQTANAGNTIKTTNLILEAIN